MTYQEDLIVEKKYLNLLDKYIYNTETDKFGMITGISISRMGISLKAYYDSLNDDSLVFFEDFKKGTLKFTLIDGGATFNTEIHEKYTNEIIDDIKSVFGEEFSEDMIIHVDDEDRKTKLEEQKHRIKQYIGSQLVNLDSFAEEVVYDSYSTLQSFCLYANGIIDEKQMLYAMVNTLAAEKRVERDMRLNTTNESFSAEIRKHLEENKDFWKELFKTGRDGKLDEAAN